MGLLSWFTSKWTPEDIADGDDIRQDVPDLQSKDALDELISETDGFNVLIMVSKDDLRVRKLLTRLLEGTTDVLTFTDKTIRSEYIPLKNCRDFDDAELDNVYLQRKTMAEVADAPQCVYIFDVHSAIGMGEVYEDILTHGKQYGISTVTIQQSSSLPNIRMYDGCIFDKLTLKDPELKKSVHSTLNRMEQKPLFGLGDFIQMIKDCTSTNKSKVLLDMKKKQLAALSA